MMRLKLLFFISLLSVVLITSCSSHNNNKDLESKIIELENKANDLKANNEELKNELESATNKLAEYEQGYKNRNFVELFSLSETFIKAYINKDIDTMKTLVSDNILINNDYLSYDYEGTNVKVYYKDSNTEISYKLNGYSYENDTAYIHFSLEEEKMDKFGGFINLTLKNTGELSIGDVTKEDWKIVMITVDI